MSEHTHTADYEKDGILHCGKCNTPKQFWLDVPLCDGTGQTKKRLVNRMCDCERAEQERMDEYHRQTARLMELNRILQMGFCEGDLLRKIYFKDADPDSENMDKAKKYVDNFAEFKGDGIGLMFYGNVGNGKTYTAAAIANELIEKFVPVAFVSTATYMSLGFEDRAWLIENHRKFDLLIVDDYGVERQTDYGIEQMYNLIDSRYKSGLPMIVTTNKLPSELENEPNIAQKRINDRVLEMCLPVQFKRESRRKAKRAEKMAAARKFFA